MNAHNFGEHDEARGRADHSPDVPRLAELQRSECAPSSQVGPAREAEGGQEAECPHAEQLGGRPRLPDQPDRGDGDRRHEGEQLEADVDERAQELRRLLVVEPQGVVGVHGLRYSISSRS